MSEMEKWFCGWWKGKGVEEMVLGGGNGGEETCEKK
jgi:hypothetical protein